MIEINTVLEVFKIVNPTNPKYEDKPIVYNEEYDRMYRMSSVNSAHSPYEQIASDTYLYIGNRDDGWIRTYYNKQELVYLSFDLYDFELKNNTQNNNISGVITNQNIMIYNNLTKIPNCNILSSTFDNEYNFNLSLILPNDIFEIIILMEPLIYFLSTGWKDAIK